ncbi:MAG: SDR family NAD(P)-dependent oxidoreductase [Acidimicrobiales bacterium]
MSKIDGLLAGRVAVVTGGGAGIGAAIAQTLAEAGAKGAVIDRIPQASIACPCGWLAIRADVRDEQELGAAFAKVTEALQQVDVVVANAGVVPPWTDPQEIDIGEWEHVFSVNALGTMLTIREAVRLMSRTGGSIVAMSSLNGWRGDPHIPAYVASKHAVVGLVRSVALGVGRLGIRVNAIAPGPVPTDALRMRMTSRAQQGGLSVDEALQSSATATALGRLVSVQEVADAALFLASELSGGITGQVLAVDAGML